MNTDGSEDPPIEYELGSLDGDFRERYLGISFVVPDIVDRFAELTEVPRIITVCSAISLMDARERPFLMVVKPHNRDVVETRVVGESPLLEKLQLELIDVLKKGKY